MVSSVDFVWPEGSEGGFPGSGIEDEEKTPRQVVSSVASDRYKVFAAR